jgi:hypothetical protein
MIPVTSRRYDRRVAAVRDARRRAAASLALLIGFLHPAQARAESSSFTVGDQAVVRVIAGNGSTVSLRAWDRPTVEVDTDDESVQVLRRTVVFGTAQNPLSVSIPLATIAVRDPATGMSEPGSLPPEEFPYASDFRAGPHDVLRVEAAAGAHVTVMVPPSTAILETGIRGSGILTVDDYHGGTLFVRSGGGRALLTDVTSAAYIEVRNGTVNVRDSSFDRLRARGNTVGFLFEHTRARQIEVTTVSGAIVYDDGTFDPGLARFESTYGSIAIGVASNAQIEARSGDGRVLSLWDKRPPIDQRGDGAASATVDGGGPVVNALTAHGNIYLYDGSLATRRIVPAEWQPVYNMMRPRELPAPSAFQRYRALRN